LSGLNRRNLGYTTTSPSVVGVAVRHPPAVTRQPV